MVREILFFARAIFPVGIDKTNYDSYEEIVARLHQGDGESVRISVLLVTGFHPWHGKRVLHFTVNL